MIKASKNYKVFLYCLLVLTTGLITQGCGKGYMAVSSDEELALFSEITFEEDDATGESIVESSATGNTSFSSFAGINVIKRKLDSTYGDVIVIRIYKGKERGGGYSTKFALRANGRSLLTITGCTHSKKKYCKVFLYASRFKEGEAVYFEVQAIDWRGNHSPLRGKAFQM